MMKKQFYRVRQLADQHIGRAEKTDLLTEDLQQVEKSVERIKLACSVTSKKLLACMQSSGPDVERRKRKLNQLQLALSMLEGSATLGDLSLLGGVLSTAGESQSAIAGELANSESEIDEQVLVPLQKMLEIDAPNIVMTKKRLSKARLDMDSCKTRWLNAVKVSHTTKTNVAESAAKADILKGEFEDATALFQSLQDALATEMFTFVAGEQNYSQCMVKVLESQMRYHEASLQILKECIPNVNKQLEQSLYRPVFGCPLNQHLKVMGRDIALVIEECVLFLLDVAMDVEGLFRLAGGSTKMKKLKAAFDAGVGGIEDFVHDIHTVPGVLKLYLRELPEPLLTFELYEEWIEANNIKDQDQKLQALWVLLNELPPANRNNLRYLMCFLQKLSQNSDINKMSASNIAIVIGPNLLWKSADEGVSIQHTSIISNICELFIEHCDWFFPEGCDFTRHQVSDEKAEALNSRYLFTETSPEVPTLSGAGNLFSEVSKKLGWKEGEHTNSGSVQGYYNPLSAQFEPERVENAAEKPLSSPCPSPIVKTKSLSSPLSLPKGHRRSQSNSSGKDVPRRPAPPIPGGPRRVPDTPPPYKPPDIPTSPEAVQTKPPKLAALAETRQIETNDQ